MFYRAILLTVLALSFIVPARGLGSPDAKDLNEFALKCSTEGLWGEAEFRLRKAIEVSPDDARLHNNLAVALEAQGKLDEAYEEYLRATNLDVRNAKYEYNLDKFIKSHKWDVQENDTPDGTE